MAVTGTIPERTSGSGVETASSGRLVDPVVAGRRRGVQPSSPRSCRARAPYGGPDQESVVAGPRDYRLGRDRGWAPDAEQDSSPGPRRCGRRYRISLPDGGYRSSPQPRMTCDVGPSMTSSPACDAGVLARAFVKMRRCGKRNPDDSPAQWHGRGQIVPRSSVQSPNLGRPHALDAHSSKRSKRSPMPAPRSGNQRSADADSDRRESWAKPRPGPAPSAPSIQWARLSPRQGDSSRLVTRAPRNGGKAGTARIRADGSGDTAPRYELPARTPIRRRAGPATNPTR